MKVAVGCDHGGFDYKDRVIEAIMGLGKDVIDFGCFDNKSVDYPDYAAQVCKAIIEKRADCGVLICGSGIGISIAANKFKGIRCALAHDHLTAELCRQHNNANVIAFGARVVGIEVVIDCVKTFLATDFLGGRHQDRINKIEKIENGNK